MADSPNQKQNKKLSFRESQNVGEKCSVQFSTERGSVRAFSNRCEADPLIKDGSTIWHYRGKENNPEVTVKPPFLIEFKEMRKGSRKDTVPLTFENGHPLPQVHLAIAILTDDFDDWISTLRYWNRYPLQEDKDLGQFPELGSFRNRLPIIFTPAPDLNTLLESADDQGIFKTWAKDWAKTWLFEMVRNGCLNMVSAWDAAARRVLKRRKQFEQNGTLFDRVISPEDQSPTNEIRVLAAIKRATQRCGGVAHLNKVRDLLELDGGPKIQEGNLRSTLRTLGFDWLPATADWTKEWQPIAKERGWI